MTAKEEANRIANIFYDGSVFDYDKEGHLIQLAKAKERALICIEEIEKALRRNQFKNANTIFFYKEVEREIYKLI
jgi:hypothetical protein